MARIHSQEEYALHLFELLLYLLREVVELCIAREQWCIRVHPKLVEILNDCLNMKKI